MSRQGNSDFPRRWRLLRDGPHPPAENMQIDEALLRALDEGRGEPTVRLYRWDRPTLSLGRFQVPGGELLLENCRAAEVAWVQRPSGGKVVFHGPDLTYCVVAPRRDIRTAGELFRRVNAVWVEALRRLGLPVEPAGCTVEGGGTADCFSTLVPCEVVLHGAKILGSAQRVRRHAVMQHGSLLTRRDLATLRRLLRPERIGILADPAPFPGTWDEALFQQAEALFIEEFAREFGCWFL
jgi:lipoyl(octanoyl) transferase